MAIRMTDHIATVRGELRIEPTPVRLRGLADGSAALDTTAALLVWEPARIVPQYAVPEADVHADLLDAADDAGPRHGPRPGSGVLTPATGFGVHTMAGRPLTLRLGGTERIGAAFRPADPDLDGYVIVDFAALDWLEEDEPVVSHPRDPLHRVDARASSRHVRIELDGTVLARSTRPVLVTETGLPARWYLPPDDVEQSLLRPSDTVTACAYKGVAAYRSVALAERTVADLAWSYPHPLRGAEILTDLVCFYTERVDVIVDGVPTTRPHSIFS